jgi:hypothetical protein
VKSSPPTGRNRLLHRRPPILEDRHEERNDCQRALPPWSESPAETQPGARHVWAREFKVWPRDFVPPSPPPIIPADAGSPDTQGRVELPYRLGDQQEASTLKYEVKVYPGEVRLLTEVNDHVLFATDSGYGQHVFYDLKNCEFKRIGGTISPYL